LKRNKKEKNRDVFGINGKKKTSSSLSLSPGTLSLVCSLSISPYAQSPGEKWEIN
jgi:hypothetical protein